MTVTPDLAKNLNLLRASPSFALRESGDTQFNVISPAIIPNDGVLYWLAGESQLPCGNTIPSVFVVADGGGSLVRVYWHINDQWVVSDDSRVPDLLSVARDSIFPFDWSYSIPVANDAFHD